MAKVTEAIQNFRASEDLSQKNTWLNRLHPVVNLVSTLLYIVTVTSFDRCDISGLLPMVFYPVILLAVSGFPMGFFIKRLLVVLPLIVLIGVFNPLFDRVPVVFGNAAVARGWITFLSVVLKSVFTVFAATLLTASAGIDNTAYALRTLKVPKILVLQLLLTYRYISVLLDEFRHILLSYSLRAPNQKGIHHSAWGSLTGQFLLRAFDKAGQVYNAMRLRGFAGEYHTGRKRQVQLFDMVYLFVWAAFFFAARFINLSELLYHIYNIVG